MLIAALALLTASQGKVNLDVVYRKIGDLELKMDIYRTAESSAPTPAAIVIHGGAWIEGKRQDMAGFASELAKRGVFATTVQYRLATADDKAPKRHYWPAMLDDVQASVRYVRAHAKEFNIDPKRIGAIGLSAGAQLAMLLGTTDTRDTKTDFYPKESSRVKAVVEFAGPTNMEKDIPEPLVFLYKAVMGDEKPKVAAQIRSMSPILFVDKKTAPMFILHGTADTTVPVIHGRNMEAALKAKGVPHEAVFVEGAGHGLEKPEAIAALFRSVDWLRDQLKE